MRRLFTLPVGLCLFAALPAFAGNWERFRGPNGGGTAQDKDIPITFDEKSGILWKLAIPGIGNSSPVVWGKQLFLQTSAPDGSERSLVCVDVEKREIMWTRSVPAQKSPTHSKNTLASSTPATDGESVFVAFWDGKEVAMAAYSMKGDFLWNKNLGQWISQHGTGASPIVYKDKVFFANDMDSEDLKTKKPVAKPVTLFALSKKTGDILWETPRAAYRACYSMPFILEPNGSPPELIVTSTTAITSYNPDDGAQNWHWNWTFKKTKTKMPLRTIASPIVAHGHLFASSGDGGGDRQMFAVELKGVGKNTVAKSAWENSKDFPYVPCLLSLGEHLYFVNDAGFAGCYEAKTGKRVWLERIHQAEFVASPVLIEDRIYAPSEQGEVHVFRAATAFQLLANNNLGERIRATPAVANGRLYIRGQNHLFCIGKK